MDCPRILRREGGAIKLNRHEEALKILSKGTFIPATPLALKEDRSMDEKTQKILIRYYLDAGVGGIATAVHSNQKSGAPAPGAYTPACLRGNRTF